jgi:hypothetical protein
MHCGGAPSAASDSGASLHPGAASAAGSRSRKEKPSTAPCSMLARERFHLVHLSQDTFEILKSHKKV